MMESSADVESNESDARDLKQGFYCKGRKHKQLCGCPIGNRRPHDYNVFSKDGPNLSRKPSAFEKAGWKRALIVNISNYFLSTRITISSMADGPNLVFEFDCERAAFEGEVFAYRYVGKSKRKVEFAIDLSDDLSASKLIISGRVI